MFRALVSLRESKQAIDFITITNELQKRIRLKRWEKSRIQLN
ncbi:hypothetical protein ACWKTL_28775 [Bacillus toyonensis]